MEGQDSTDSPLVNLNNELKEGKVVATDAEKMRAGTARAEKAVVSQKNVEELEEVEEEEVEECKVKFGPRRMPMDPKLHRAVTKGDECLLEQLLRSEEEDHAREGEVAINMTNGTSMVSCLLGVTYTGETALHLAASFDHFKLAELICEKNRSLLMRRNTDFETPLHYAAKAGHAESVISLIKLARNEGGNVLKNLLRERNKNGETALYQAILHGQVAMVEQLLLIDLCLARIADDQHISPLCLAALQSSDAIVTTLVRLLPDNAPRSAYRGPDGQTALHAASLRDIGLLRKMLDWKPELAKAVDKSGSTPLHYAASHNLPESVEVFLEKDIFPAYTSDFSGLYPVHVAAKLGHVEVIKGFFKRCPDSDKLLDRQGRNFLHLAVEEKREAVVRWVCKHSNLIEPLNAQDNEGNTPIHLAVKAKMVGIFALLLGSKNVDLCITDRNRLTPRDLFSTNNFNRGMIWENSNLFIIYQALKSAECCCGIHRVDHLIGQPKLQMDPEKKEKALSNYENMAKSFGIISGLIASAAVTATFTVSAAYKADVLAGKSTNGISLAFKVFILVNTFAFLSTITATILLVRASLIVLDPTYRSQYLARSSELVNIGSKAFIAAFAVGVYVVVTPVSKWLAILVSVVCCIMLILEPHKRPNRSIAWALFNRRNSWVELFEDGPVSDAIKLELISLLEGKLAFALCIIIVLSFSSYKGGHLLPLVSILFAVWWPCASLFKCWPAIIWLRSILLREVKKRKATKQKKKRSH